MTTFVCPMVNGVAVPAGPPLHMTKAERVEEQLRPGVVSSASRGTRSHRCRHGSSGRPGSAGMPPAAEPEYRSASCTRIWRYNDMRRGFQSERDMNPYAVDLRICVRVELELE